MHAWVLGLTLALPAHAQEPEELVKRGLALMKASRPQDAERALRRVLERDPDRVDARTLLGLLLLERGAVAEAEASLRRALELDPRNESARFGLGLALSRRGETRAASTEFEQLLHAPQVGTSARTQWILARFIAGLDDEACQAARDAVSAHPTVAEYHRLLGFLLHVRGKLKEAIHAYVQSLEIDPANLEAHVGLVSLFARRQEWQSALDWCDRALNLDPSHPVLHRERAQALARLGRDTEARAAEATADRVYTAETHYIRSVRARAAGRTAEEERFLRETVAANPQSSRAWADLGELLKAGGRLKEAREAFLMAVETDPEKPRGWLGLASAQEAGGDRAAAVATLRRALARGLAGADLRASLATILWELGRPEEARAEMTRAVDEFPGDPSLLTHFADLQQSLGRWS